MHDINGKVLHVGDEITSLSGYIPIREHKLAKITSVEDEDNVAHEGAQVVLTYSNGDKGSCRLLQIKAVKVRTWKEMATEALAVQDACNLSAVVISFGHIIAEIRARLESEGTKNTDNVNQHPICQLYSDKVAHLTNTQSFGHDEVSKAYKWAYDMKGGA